MNIDAMNLETGCNLLHYFYDFWSGELEESLESEQFELNDVLCGASSIDKL